MAGQPGTFGAPPGLETAHERSRAPLTHGLSLSGIKAVDLPLDREDRVHAADRFERERGNGRQLAAGLGGDVGQHEELAPGMTPARRFDERPWPALAGV